MKGKVIIENWYQREWTGSLVLPDGWYGRPFDGQHRLTSVNEAPEHLTIVLDNALTLSFSGPTHIESLSNELRFTNFNELIFEANPFSGIAVATNAKRYSAGEVKIISRPQ